MDPHHRSLLNPMSLESLLLDGSLWVGVGTALVGTGAIIYRLWTRQGRIRRDLYGSDEDKTREGLIVEQSDAHAELIDRMDTLEANVDEQFDALGDQIADRHADLVHALLKLADTMDDPPDDLDFDLYGPYRNASDPETDPVHPDVPGDERWVDETETEPDSDDESDSDSGSPADADPTTE